MKWNIAGRFETVWWSKKNMFQKELIVEGVSAYYTSKKLSFVVIILMIILETFTNILQSAGLTISIRMSLKKVNASKKCHGKPKSKSLLCIELKIMVSTMSPRNSFHFVKFI